MMVEPTKPAPPVIRILLLFTSTMISPGIIFTPYKSAEDYVKLEPISKPNFCRETACKAPYGPPLAGPFKKDCCSCISNWEYSLRMLWGPVDTELPFISQDILS